MNTPFPDHILSNICFYIWLNYIIEINKEYHKTYRLYEDKYYSPLVNQVILISKNGCNKLYNYRHFYNIDLNWNENCDCKYHDPNYNGYSDYIYRFDKEKSDSIKVGTLPKNY